MKKSKERASMALNLDRRSAGQWMTDGDPFYMPVFAEWLESVYSKIGKARISACEPYAGKLGLVAHLRARGLDNGRIDWSAYDIAPQDELLADGIEIGKANTLRSIPSSPYDLIVTNPPYLARNSARRRGLPFPFDERGIGIEKPADLYQFALDTCLESASYCVMLIPESFITCRYDKSRCDAILSLRGGLFEDTDCPVCLALFSPHGREGGPLIYSNGGKLLGSLDGIRRESDRLIGNKANPIKMNDPNGDCSLIAIDSTAGRSIRSRNPSEGRNANMEKKLNGKAIMVTGGTGFIGSHTVVDLLEKGYRAVIVDDLSNSSKVVLDRIAAIVGDEAAANMSFHEADVSDAETLDAIFREEGPIDAVIHFAGYKAVGESVQKPIEYYSNNLGTTLTLIDTMRRNDCKSIVFSSSATVYGDPDSLPLDESAPKKPATNPYGWTKWMIEQILTDTAAADPEWNVVLLRYFNPVGAHPSGLMGEDPKGIPNNLMPFVSQVAVGRRDAVHVFGDDYPTPDGTGVRDYIHVCDLASGHVAALDWMDGKHGTEIFNLGTGKGTSVLEIIKAFSRACGRDLPYVIDPRRPGDIAENYAGCEKASGELGWKATRDIDDMCRDSWNWQSRNPNGYEG